MAHGRSKGPPGGAGRPLSHRRDGGREKRGLRPELSPVGGRVICFVRFPGEKNKSLTCIYRPGTCLTEVETGFEPVYTALQAVASPLGHSTRNCERTTGFEPATLTLAR